MTKDALIIGLGGAAGAVARYLISSRINERFSSIFPVGTFAVNTAGAFLLAILLKLNPGAKMMLLLAEGFTASFSTFSTLFFEAAMLFSECERKEVYAYLSASFLAGALAFYAGLKI